MKKVKTTHIDKYLFNDKGAAALEFAIVAPVFILLMFGMLAYGIYFGAAHSVQQLAADAARASIPGLTETERQELANSFLKNNADSYLLLAGEDVKVMVGGSTKSRHQFDVSVEFDARNLPIWSLYSPLPLPSKTIRRTSTIRLGGI